MHVEIRGESDPAVVDVARALESYLEQHPRAKIAVYRQNSVSIRARLIDPDFKGLSRTTRHDAIWKYFEPLDEMVQDQIILLLLLTPDEVAKSFANFDFENPILSRL